MTSLFRCFDCVIECRTLSKEREVSEEIFRQSKIRNFRTYSEKKMLRFACTKVTPIVRPLRITTRHAKRARTQARSNETIFTEAAASTPGQMIPGYSLGAKLTGGCAGLALGAMVG